MDILTKVENKIKALSLAVSHDSTRPTLSMASVELSSESENGYIIVATDGHVLLAINSIPWEELVLFYRLIHSYELPENPTNGALNVNPKIKKENKMPFFFENDGSASTAQYFPYPQWRNVVPSEFKNELIERPLLSSVIFERANKINKLVSGLDFRGIHFWNGPLNATMTAINSLDSMLIMPYRGNLIDTKGKVQSFNIFKGLDLNSLELVELPLLVTSERLRLLKELQKDVKKTSRKAVASFNHV